MAITIYPVTPSFVAETVTWTWRGSPPTRGRALIDELLAHVSQRRFVYTHRWREKDLVMWDNRCTLHRGTDYDDLRFVRDMHRTTVSDVANTCEQKDSSDASASREPHEQAL